MEKKKKKWGSGNQKGKWGSRKVTQSAIAGLWHRKGDVICGEEKEEKGKWGIVQIFQSFKRVIKG